MYLTCLVFSPTSRPTSRPTSKPSSNPTGQPSVQPSSRPTPKPVPAAAAKKGLSSGAIAGIVIAVLAAISATVLIYFYCKRQQSKDGEGQHNDKGLNRFDEIELANKSDDYDEQQYDKGTFELVKADKSSQDFGRYRGLNQK